MYESNNSIQIELHDEDDRSSEFKKLSNAIKEKQDKFHEELFMIMTTDVTLDEFRKIVAPNPSRRSS